MYWSEDETPSPALGALLVVLSAVIAEIDDVPLEDRSTEDFLNRLQSKLDNLDAHISVLLLDDEQSLRIWCQALFETVRRYQELS